MIHFHMAMSQFYEQPLRPRLMFSSGKNGAGDIKARKAE